MSKTHSKPLSGGKEFAMYLIQRIEEAAARYNDARRSVALTILDHRDELYSLSMQDIAGLSCTSKATVVRFVQCLGYAGWKDFRKDYIAELQYQNSHGDLVDTNYPFSKNSSQDEIARSICLLMQQSAEETLQKLDLSMVTRAVNLIQGASRVVIFCVSPHIYTAQLFARKMLTIQKSVQVCVAREMGITVRTLTSRDLAIIVSYAGNNPEAEPMKIADYLLANRIPTVVITSEGSNYLRSRFSNVLSIPARERLYTKIATFATEEAVQLIFNTLFACYFGLNFEKNDTNKVHTAKFLEEQERRGGDLDVPA